MEKCDTCITRYVCEEQAEFICKQRNYCDYSPDYFAIAKPAEKVEDVANWIPVAVQLPKTDGRFMVTIKGKSGKPHVEMRNFHAGPQTWERMCYEEKVLAWQARPRPYGSKPKEG